MIKLFTNDGYSFTPDQYTSTLKIKKVHPDAEIRQIPGSCGIDLKFLSYTEKTRGVVVVDTGIQVEPEDGYYVELHARSSLHKYGWQLANCVGIIDPTYRGNIYVVLTPLKDDMTNASTHGPGGPVDPTSIGFGAQLIMKKFVYPEIRFADELTDTVRGEGGFGSTGK